MLGVGLLYTIGVGHHKKHGEIQHLHCRTSFCVHTVRKCNLKGILTFCEAELEEVSGQEREQQIRRQLLIPSPLQIETGLRVNHLSWKYRDIRDILAALPGTLKGTSLKMLCSVIEQGKTVAGKNVCSPLAQK